MYNESKGITINILKNNKAYLFIILLSLFLIFIVNLDIAYGNNIENSDTIEAAVSDLVLNTGAEGIHNAIRNATGADPVWRNRTRNDEVIFRWDHRDPDIVFEQGFWPNREDWEGYDNFGDDPLTLNWYLWNIVNYVRGYNSAGVVSTTYPSNGYTWFPDDFRSTDYYRYEIIAPGGILVTESFSSILGSVYREQNEIVFPGGIRREFIRAAYRYEEGQLMEVIVNPHFVGDKTVSAPQNITVRMWDGGTSHQLFRPITNPEIMRGPGGFISYSRNNYLPRVLADGEYLITSNDSIENAFALELTPPNSGYNHDRFNVKMYERNGFNNQLWNITYDHDNDGYIIKNRAYNDRLLSAPSSPGDYVYATIQSEHENQFWHINYNYNGYFSLTPNNDTYLYLVIDGEYPSNEARLILSNSIGTQSSSWNLEPSITLSNRIIPEGNYMISNKTNQNEVITMINRRFVCNSNDRVVNAQRINNSDHTISQIWSFLFSPLKNAYIITNRDFYGMRLAWDSSRTNKAFAQYYGSNNDTNYQYWIPELHGQDYIFRNLANPHRVLDLGRSITNNVYDIFLNDYSEELNQKWSLTRIQ